MNGGWDRHLRGARAHPVQAIVMPLLSATFALGAILAWSDARAVGGWPQLQHLGLALMGLWSMDPLAGALFVVATWWAHGATVVQPGSIVLRLLGGAVRHGFVYAGYIMLLSAQGHALPADARAVWPGIIVMAGLSGYGAMQRERRQHARQASPTPA